MTRGRKPLQRGDVVLVTFPFTDLSGSKKRPAVVYRPKQHSQLTQFWHLFPR